MDRAIYELKELKLSKLNQNSPLDKWFYTIIQKHICDLTLEDISHMLRRGIFLDIAVPCAWEKILEDPLCGELYDGEMIELLGQVLANSPSMKNNNLYVLLAEKIQNTIKENDWGSEEEKMDYISIFENFRILF